MSAKKQIRVCNQNLCQHFEDCPYKWNVTLCRTSAFDSDGDLVAEVD